MKMSMMDMFCSSPASTATSSSSSITPRLIRVFSTPCRTSASSDVDTICPKPAVNRHEYKQLLQKQISGRKSTSSGSCCGADGSLNISGVHIRRKSSADVSDIKLSSTSREAQRTAGNNLDRPVIRMLSDTRRTHANDDQKKHTKTVDRRKSSRGSSGSETVTSNENNDSPKRKSLSGYYGSSDKVVVLWVSLHCKGCEAKVRKHISKMEGVKSFSTDWMTKRVTIISNMDPHDVLASVSTVKYARFWHSSSSSSSTYHYSPTPFSSSSTLPLLALTR